MRLPQGREAWPPGGRSPARPPTSGEAARRGGRKRRRLTTCIFSHGQRACSPIKIAGSMTHTLPITAADLRALLARERRARYIVAARVGINPTRLGRVLNGRLTLRPELALRIAKAVESLRQEREP